METRTSSNISEDRRVVLTALREVPEETTFMLSEATQDHHIKNRYWLDFPSQWANQPNKDPIIGIRSIYFTKTNRFIKYSYKITLNDVAIETLEPQQFVMYEPIDTIEGTIAHWFDGGTDTIKQIVTYFNDNWLTKGNRTLTYEHHTWQANEIQCYYGYDRQSNKMNLYFGRGIGEDPYYTYTNDSEQKLLPYGIEITPLTDDAKVLFNTTGTLRADPDQTKPCRIEIPTWSRHQCLVKSSIATNDKNNILGHTRNDTYNPIKYYRLYNGIKKFWIELYETRFHNCGVEFPTKVYETDEDKKKEIDRDDLFIEAIVCFTAQGML